MKNRVLTVALLVALSGCSIGPQYQRPDLDVPSSFRGQEEAAAAKSIGDLSWSVAYADPTLRSLIETALRQNRDVKLAAARVAEARALAGESGLGRWPQIGLAAGGEKGRIVQSNGYVTGALFNAQGEVSYEVDLWRRLASLNDADKATLLATAYAREAVVVGLVSNVATAYYNLCGLDEQLHITTDTIANRQRFLDLTQKQANHGAASGLDLNRAEASLALARANAPDLQRQIAQTENQLQILLGQNPGATLRHSTDLRTVPAPPAVPAGLPSSLLERRPDLREAEANLAGATANVRAAKAALFPTISLTGNLGYESVAFSQLFTGATKIWTLGLNLVQPILDAKRNGYAVDAARAREDQAILQYQSAVAQAFREVSDALAARRGYTEFLAAQDQQVKALRDAHSRVLERYNIGYASYFEVIDIDTSLFAAELQWAQTYRNNLVAAVQLYQALGGGWDVMALETNGSPPLPNTSPP